MALLGSFLIAGGVTLAVAGPLAAVGGFSIALFGVNLVAKALDGRGLAAHLEDRRVRQRLRRIAKYRKERFGGSSA